MSSLFCFACAASRDVWRPWLLLVALSLSAIAGAFAATPLAAADLEILPGRSLTLANRAARQRVVAEWREGKNYLGEARDGLVWRSSDEQVVTIANGVLIPRADGKATITAECAGKSATAEVEVRGQSEPHVWNFRNQVESVLSKGGCNGGACHGARAGKNGFRLSLFAFDPEADYSYLTRQANGRRIVPTDPGRSLLLTKPTGTLPHKGGVRFEPDSLEYRVLAEWIAAGSPGPKSDDPGLVRLEVLPKNSRQQIGATQQLVVRAHFSNGAIEDVTRWAKYSSVNGTVANVAEDGRVEIIGSGEGAIKVWYLNWNELAFFSVPYRQQVPPEAFTQAERRNFIDELVIRKLSELNIPPSPLCDDSTFIRRAYLDTLGVLPTVEELQAFIADPAAEKRDRLVDQLLSRPEFVDYWSYKWSDLLLVSGERLRPKAVETYYGWIREQVTKNTPWDEFVRQLVTATGSTVENGAANYYALHQDPEDMAETTAQAFLGLSMNCARCHNHPMEKWTNDQYYGLANLFSRVRSKGWGGDFRSGDGIRVVFADTQGELLQPSKGKAQPPRPLDAAPLAFDDPSDRRVYFAKWLTSPENPYFARTIANRVWANYFGVGLVEKVDDLRVTNPASNEELLTAAAQYLVQQRFDLKELMRAMLRSATYQRVSKSLPENAADERFYSHYYPKRLRAEVLLDSLAQVTGAPTEFKNADNKPYPKGTRAQQLPDSFVESYFLKSFGRPDRLITCDCERSDEPNVTQALHFINGETLLAKLKAPGNRLEGALAAGRTNEQILDELFVAALSRPPTDGERRKLTELVAGAPENERRQVLEDLYWSVLTSREFLFNH